MSDTMTINSVIAYALEYPEPHDHGKLRCITLARVETTDGAVGWGECISQLPESALATKTIIEQGFAPLLVGENPVEVERLWHKMLARVWWYGPQGITGIRLEALPDSSLPEEGSGRAENGNFVLSEFRVSAAPLNDSARAKPVILQNAIADFAQSTFGGWPVAAAIDGDSQTGWQVDPEEGWPHEAIFELKEPPGGKGGSKLTFTLDQNTPEAHTLGHFRLAVTTDKPPLALDIVSRKPEWRVKGQAPPCPNGGLLVVSAELTQRGGPFMFKNAQSHFTYRGVLAGREISLEPVLRGPGYPASWQAWRIPLKSSAPPQPFELQVNATVPAGVNLTFTGHFIPAAEL